MPSEAEKELLLRVAGSIDADISDRLDNNFGNVEELVGRLFLCYISLSEARTISRVLRDAVSPWRPIETAPRTGKDVLLCRGSMPPIVAGWYDNGEEAGWSAYDKPDVWIIGDPTHWMPPPRLRPASKTQRSPAMGENWTFDGPADNIIIWSGPGQRVAFLASTGPTVRHAKLICAAPKMRDAGQQLIEALELYGFPVSPEAWANAGPDAPTGARMSVEAQNLHRAAVAFRKALSQALEPTDDGR